MQKEKNIFYGWWIVAVFFVSLFMGAGIAATHTVFFKSIINDFNWSRAAFSAVLSVNVVIGSLTAPIWGRLVDRRGARIIVPCGIAIVGTSLLLLSIMQSMVHAYLFYILLAIGAGGMSLVPISTTISHWFNRRRGLAMGITLAGASLGGMALAPLAGVILRNLGWRFGYRLYGISICIIIIPLMLLILRQSPKVMGLLPDGDKAIADPENLSIKQADAVKLESLSLKQAFKTLTFWMIAIGFMLPMFAGRALLIHLVPILTDSGISAETAAGVYGFTVGLSLLGRLGFGFAADKFSIRHIYALCYAIEALGIFCLLGLKSFGNFALLGFVIIFGSSYGGGMSLSPLLIGKCFGISSMGEIFGALGIAAMIGGAFGPVFAGFIYDRMGNYHVAFMVFLALQIISVVAIYNARTVIGRLKLTKDI
jgi:MFS family permease